MSKKILTLAVLEAALVELAAKAKGSSVETDIEIFQKDFKTFCDQPITTDQSQIKALQNENVLLKSTVSQHEASIDTSKGIITQLKGQLEEALAVKANTSDRPIVTVGGVKYKVNHGAHPHSAKHIAANPDIAKQILAIKGQNALTKL